MADADSAAGPETAKRGPRALALVLFLMVLAWTYRLSLSCLLLSTIVDICPQSRRTDVVDAMASWGPGARVYLWQLQDREGPKNQDMRCRALSCLGQLGPMGPELSLALMQRFDALSEREQGFALHTLGRAGQPVEPVWRFLRAKVRARLTLNTRSALLSAFESLGLRDGPLRLKIIELLRAHRAQLETAQVSFERRRVTEVLTRLGADGR